MRTDAVLLAVVVVLVPVLLGTAAALRRGGEADVRRIGEAAVPVRTIRMAGDSEYFTDPDVVRELELNGFRIEQKPKGSVGIADLSDLDTAYDVANAGSDNAADHIITALKENHGVTTASKISPFSSPMVIITYQPIVALLEKEGIARKSDNGTWVFEVSAYLEAVRQKKRWIDIQGNAVYRSTNRALISTTDPTLSNSGGMLMAIETYVANDGSPVNDVAAFQQARPESAQLIKSTFVDQGGKLWHTPPLLALFLRDGMSRYPMGMFYEKDYINTKLQDPAALGEAVLMYPNPTVISDNTFVWWGQAGQDFANLLSTDQKLIDLAEKHGYHAITNPVRFANDMAGKGVTIANLDDSQTDVTVAPLPTEKKLTQLITELGK